MCRLLTLFATVTLAAAGISAPAAEPVDMKKRAEELKSLKWGMFVCWSFSTFSGKEWSPGVKDVAFFKATEVDTDQWARTAKEAGMGYIDFLTKHHDGFCLWDTKTTQRKVTKTPLGKDVLGLLRKSCDKYGIKLALYFSENEFDDNKDYHPGGYSVEMKKAQIKELLTEYGPIEYIWFDHAMGDAGLSHDETTKWCKQFQPGCFVGYNGGQASGDIRIGEEGHPATLEDASGGGLAAHDMVGYKGYLVAEFTYPILPTKHEGGAYYFYSLPKHDGLCKSAESLYKDYLGAVKYGNIFSIDVGPDYAGRLREIDVKTLRQVGEMIRNPPLSEGKAARASSTWGNGYEANMAFDADDVTRWSAAPDSRSGWIEIDLGKPATVGRVVVKELNFHPTQQFAIEYKDGEAWKTVVTGTTIVGEKTLRFPAVQAQIFRLNIVKANAVPTIEEFQLFAP
ncbi:MAG: alpha-L-fucosidase [Verrucomicrobia bacterium]|nr:alpha-L-fucosidase [Verrucomicrobiota bacterium]